MRDFLTVVSGVPRSGTSMVMRMLAAGGIPVLTDNIRQPDASNPHGYFEYEPVKRLRQDATWVAPSKGMAVKVIYRLLPELPADVPTRILFLERDLNEVIASQREMLVARGDAAAGQDEALLLAAFTKELAVARSYLATQQVLYLPHAEVIARPLLWAEKIAAFLDAGFDTAAMAAAVDPALYRQRRSNFQ